MAKDCWRSNTLEQSSTSSWTTQTVTDCLTDLTCLARRRLRHNILLPAARHAALLPPAGREPQAVQSLVRDPALPRCDLCRPANIPLRRLHQSQVNN